MALGELILKNKVVYRWKQAAARAKAINRTSFLNYKLASWEAAR
jgi:hypothetical protein